MPHTLVIVRVPEVEPLVARLRERFDPAARRGLGAHVTLLHAPLSANGIDTALTAAIAATASAVAPFHYQVTALARFPGTLYLAVEPPSAFEELHARLAMLQKRAGASPAGGGPAHARKFVPHISVVRKSGADDAMREAEAELTRTLAAHAPLRCECRELVLLEDSTGVWRQVAKFTLSGCTDSPSPAPS